MQLDVNAMVLQFPEQVERHLWVGRRLGKGTDTAERKQATEL